MAPVSAFVCTCIRACTHANTHTIHWHLKTITYSYLKTDMYTKTHVEHCRIVQSPTAACHVFCIVLLCLACSLPCAVAGASWKPVELPGVAGRSRLSQHLGLPEARPRQRRAAAAAWALGRRRRGDLAEQTNAQGESEELGGVGICWDRGRWSCLTCRWHIIHIMVS